MRSFIEKGADLVCFSAKYFGGPNSGGFICGCQDLIDAVAGIDFTDYEAGKYRTFGRPFKLDRHVIVGVVVALKEWLEMDHSARWEGYARKVHYLCKELQAIPDITAQPKYFTMDERLIEEPVNCLAIHPESRSGWSAQKISDALIDGEPSIATPVVGDILVVAMDTLLEGEEFLIAKRLKDLLMT
jgi:L-seryl-tRNA(Ser) seleniumtransferase